MRSKLMLFYLVIGAFTIFTYDVVGAYKYLAVLHTAAPSHFFVTSSLLKALAQRGHEVYVISAFPQKQPIPNYQDIPITSVIKRMEDDEINFLDFNDRSGFGNILNYFDTTELVLKDPSVQKLMASNHTFDAVICEVFLAEALFGFSEHFNAPLIGISAFGSASVNTDMVGSPSPPSYVASIMVTFSDHMSLIERVENLGFITFFKALLRLHSLPRQAALYRKYFPHLERDMYDVRKNAALVLVNTHVSLGYPRPYMPNQIEVGGMHINRQRKPLPEDIAKFINESEHGVIYFSMGSHVKSKFMPLELKKEILKAFRSLRQRVLWKFEDRTLEDIPDNVFIRDWFPQDDILAHDKVKVFITHGGLLSTTESIYHRTPIIGIPIFFDQFLNIARAEKQGYGIQLDYKKLNANNLLKALKQVLNDDSFRQRITEISERYRDQEMLPMEKAIYWVEHVVRHKGAKYLHCAGQDLNFIEYHNLDAMLILFGGIVFVIVSVGYLILLLVKFLLRSMRPTTQRNKEKTN